MAELNDQNIVKTKNPFGGVNLTPEEKTAYDHGYSSDQGEQIKRKKEAIEKRDLNIEPVSIEEFKEVIVPWNRIHRTEAFIINKPKEKKAGTRTTTPKIAKVAKPKKLTKKQITEKMEKIIFKMAKGETLNEEEQQFFEEQSKQASKL